MEHECGLFIVLVPLVAVPCYSYNLLYWRKHYCRRW